MTRIHTNRAAAILIVLLAAALVATVLWAVTDSTPAHAAKQTVPRALRTVSILPAAFTPMTDDVDFRNDGVEIGVNSVGEQAFVAQVFFPQSVVTLRKLTLIGYDAGAQDVCLTLFRLDPESNPEQLAMACSTGTPGFATVVQATNAPRRMLMRHGALLIASVPPGNDYRFYGARILYGY